MTSNNDLTRIVSVLLKYQTSVHHTFCASVCLCLCLCLCACECLCVCECVCVCLHFIIHYGHCNLALQQYGTKTDRNKMALCKREKNVQLFFVTKTLCNGFTRRPLKIKDFVNNIFKSIFLCRNYYILIQFPWIWFPMILETKPLHWCCNDVIQIRPAEPMVTYFTDA